MRAPSFLAAASVAVLALANGIPIFLAPETVRPVLLISALLAITAAVGSARGDRAEFVSAQLLSLPPIVVLASTPADFAIVPLSVLIIVAGELNVLSWDLRGQAAPAGLAHWRLMPIIKLAAGGLLVGWLVQGTTVLPGLPGSGALLLGAAAIVTLTFVLFGHQP